MQKSIAYLSSASAADRERWCRHLALAMPEETIIPFDAMSDAARRACDLAIVADPDPELLKMLPALRWVQSLYAGVEKIVKQIPDAPFRLIRLEDPEMARKMAEAVVAWTLYLHRDMPAYADQQRHKIWREQDHTRAGGRHIGIIGMGHLGAAAAAALRALHFTVSGWSRSAKAIKGIATYSGEDGLAAMLAEVEIVVLLIPVTDATRGLINTARLASMQDGVQIINFARGAIIRTDDLLAALESGKVRHAVLDVFDQEPLPETSPLWSHPSVTVLPHISGPTNRETASAIVARNIRRYRKTGAMPKGVDMARGY